MRQLTLLSYLEEYLKGVSGQKSVSIHKLTILMDKNIRILSPLILYSALTDNKALFNKYTNNKYEMVLNKLNANNFLDEEFQEFDFQKIYSSYQSRINKYNYEKETKKKARDSIVTIMKHKKITNYRIYKDLHLNPGNINDYLTNNNPSKVSLSLAKRIYNYVTNY